MKPYAAYKDSGIEWLGKIPHNRETIKLKYIMQNFDSRRIPLSSEERAGMQGDYPYYGSNGIVDQVNDYLFDGEYILLGEDGAPFFEMYKDVAFLVTGKFWVNNHAHILKASLNHNQRFLTYLLNCVDYRKYITGSTRDKLTQDDMKSIILSIAKLDEQKIIAAYLDHKTAQIDDLIAKKERMIELLKEERFAIINQAVTKGINPDVEYKDSGIEWLGKIPKHWELKRLKYIFNFNTGWTPPTGNSEYFTGKNKWVNIGDMNKKFIYNTQNYISDRAIQESRIKLSPRFSLMYSFKLTVGKVAFAGCDLYTNEAIISILPNDKDNLQFYYYLLPEILTYNSRENIYGAKLLNQGLIKNSYLILPPPEEQKIIVAFLDRETAKIDTLIAKQGGLIEALKEYRTTLISEVVTGKIDVREYAV